MTVDKLFSACCLLTLLLISAACGPAPVEPGEDAVITRDNIDVRYDAASRGIAIADREAGILLEDIQVSVLVGNLAVGTGDEDDQIRAGDTAEGPTITIDVADHLSVRITLTGNDTIDIHAESSEKNRVFFNATSARESMPAILENAKETDRSVLLTTLGPVQVRELSSIFLPAIDTALAMETESIAHWSGDPLARRFSTQPGGNRFALSIKVDRHYFRDTLGIEFYAPMEKRGYWHTAPMVAMTWYGIEGWKGRPAQRREWLEPQVDWVARNLLPYAGDLVFQLDDNYPHDDNAFMRDLSDMIRKRGLIPGIWFTPFGVAPRGVADAHPDWFLRDAAGKPLTAFGGVNWSDEKGAPPVLNVTDPEAVEKWYAMFWKRASDDWNFDFFKIDGQPTVAKRYRESANGNGVSGYRKGLAIGREVVGADKFINGCWGTPVDALGIVNGSRTGPDTGNWPHATGVVLRWNFLNNVCWWSDPDAAANLFKATVERTRHNAQARALTGQQFLTDDVWTDVPEANLGVWQRSHPTLDIRPVNLYPIENWQEYDLFDLRIAKSWGTWDVAGLFNYDGTATVKTLDLGRLRLEAPEAHLYEYWTGTYLGRFTRDARISRIMAPHGGQLFSIVPASGDRPDLISTSRHASQGGLDLQGLNWNRDKGRHVAEGLSSRLVPGDPSELVFVNGPCRAVEATCSPGSAAIEEDGAVTRVVLDTAGESAAHWTVTFEELSAPFACMETGELHVEPGSSPSIGIRGSELENRSLEFISSDPRIRTTPDAPTSIVDTDRASVPFEIDLRGLPPGTIFTGKVEVSIEGIETVPRACLVRALIPWPENLALGAEATASSIWSEGFEARRVNDADTKTRWNSVKGETRNAWVELAWDEAVTIDRVVIDECVDWGNRIESWRLDAEKNDGTRITITRGEGVGRRFIVDLEQPTTTAALRLIVEKASDVPTIWELETYRWRSEER